MRIYNRTSIEIDRPLWRLVARAIGLSGALPAASRDFELFDRAYLRVFVRPVSGAVPTAGSYTCGDIEVYCCGSCSSGRVLWTYTHELIHAWIDSYAPTLYFEDCESLADDFADHVLVSVGGSIDNRDSCATYQMPARRSMPDHELTRVVDRFVSQRLPLEPRTERSVGLQQVERGKKAAK